MRKAVSLLIVSVICFLSVFNPLQSILAFDDITISNEIWQDDFSTDTINKYTVTGPDNGKFGNWQVTDGKLQVTGTAAATNWWTTTLLLGDTNYDNFVMEFDAEVSTGYGVFFRGEDDGKTLGSGYNKWFGGNAYLLMHHNPIDASNGEYMALYKYNESQTLIKKLDEVGSMGTLEKVHWILTVKDDSIIVTVSDLEDSDNRYTYIIEDTTYTAGSIGFYNTTRSGVTSLKIDNLTVTPINALYENDFSNTETVSDFFTAGPDAGAWGNWQVANGNLQVTGNTGANWWGTSAFVSQKYDNFVMEFDAVSTVGYGLIFRASSKEGLNSWFGGDGYCAMHWNPTNATNGRYAELYDYSGKDTHSCIKKYCEIGQMASMTNMHWRVVTWDDTITIEISNNNSNKSYVYTIDDSKYESGYIGFYSLTYAGNTSLKIDNLSINGYKLVENTDPDVNEDDNEFTSCESVWTDDFSTDTISNYKVTGPENGKSGNWKIADGILSLEGNDEADSAISALMLKEKAYSDFVIEFDVKASEEYGVFFRAQDDAQQNGVGLNRENDGKTYWLGVSNIENVYSISLLKHSGSEHELGKKEISSFLGDAHWKLIVDNNRIYLAITDELSNEVITADFTNSNYSIGMLGFYGLTKDNEITLEIDNLVITPITNSLYENDFSDSATLEDFIIAGPDNGIFGEWDMLDGKLQVTGTEEAESWWGTSIVTNKLYGDYILEFDANVMSGYGVFFRTADDASVKDYGLNQWFGGNGYAAMHWNAQNSEEGRYSELYNYAGFGKQSLIKQFQKEGEMSSLTNVHWKVIAWGDTIVIQINSNIDTDIEYTYILNDDTYYSGRVGFYNLTHNGITSLKIDNMSIRGIEYGTQPELTPYETEDFIFEDDFSTDKSGSYTSYGEWYVNEKSESTGTSYASALGNEGGSKTGYSFYYYNEMLTNFTMEFDVKSNNAAEYGVMLRAGTRGYSQYTGDGYMINFDGKVITCGKVYGTYEPIRSGNYSYTVPSNITLSHWKVVCEGNSIQLFINDSTEPVIAINDISFTLGYAGLRVKGSNIIANNVVFDNLVISGRRYLSGITSSNYASSRGKGDVYDYYSIPETPKKANKIR